MEEQPQLEEMQSVAYQHANGEVFVANDLEAARGMCPVLGKLSLEEADLLLELEAMGKEQVIDQPTTDFEKPAVEAVEVARPKPQTDVRVAEPWRNEVLPGITTLADDLDQKRAEPITDAITDEVSYASIESIVPAVVSQQLEAEHLVLDELPVHKEALPVLSEGVELPKASLIIPRIQGVARSQESTLVEHTPPPKPLQAVTDEARPIIKVIKAASPQSVEKPFEQPTVEDGIVGTEPVVVRHEASWADEAIEVEGLILVKTPQILPLTENFEPEPLQPIIADKEQSVTEITTGAEMIENEPPALIPGEALTLLAVLDLPTGVVPIESTMSQLEEALESDEPQETAKINAILEEIIALPTTLEGAADEEGEVLDEKLEELFVELFEEADISYTPALIKSFVKLTKAHYLEQLLEITVTAEADSQDLPEEIGTREFLQKLQQGLRVMKQTVMKFYEIGKSILRLYASSPA